MKKEDITKLVANPRMISGIYNYCDRWCERCPFTSRCANFAIREQVFSDPRDLDLKNERFWKKLHAIFQVTLEMVRETAEEQGIDLDSLDMEAAAETESNLWEAANNHECVRFAVIYSKMVDDWFDSARDLFEEKRDELVVKARLELPDSKPFDEAATLKDAYEVIRWYQDQIQVKLVRAVGGKVEDATDDLEGFPKDSDGSAKIALIGMDRSIASWGIMLRHYSDQEGEILNTLVHLQRLRARTEEFFPDARAFMRPGFDDDQANGDGGQDVVPDREQTRDR